MILLTLVVMLSFAACGGNSATPISDTSNKPNTSVQTTNPETNDTSDDKSDKKFEFPQREFVTDWAVYQGSGIFVFTNPGGKLDDKTAAMTYLNEAKVEDVQMYINTLKENGLMPDETFNDEELDQYGSLIWFGGNTDKRLCVSVSYYQGGDEIEDILYNTGTHQYNLMIQVANYDFMNEL